MNRIQSSGDRGQIRIEDLPEALAALIWESIQRRKAAGDLPALLEALERADGSGPGPAAELLALHLAAFDIALQVDGRFNGLVHQTILKETAEALAESHPYPHEEEPPTDGHLEDVLRVRLPVYLDWMYEFVSALLDPERQEPRELLGLDDPTDSSVVILALGELLSVCHGSLSRWDLVG